MSEFTALQRRILEQYTKPIVHMRQRRDRRRLTLVLGAGASDGFKIPRWDNLLESIAEDPKVRAKALLDRNKRRSHGSRTQVLFHRFAAKMQARDHSVRFGKIKEAWRTIIRKHLYKSCPKDIDLLVGNHPYIEPFLRVVQESRITVTYNFDDCIEKILHKMTADSSSGEHARSFETVWDPQLQTKLDQCVIYHPNGFLPQSGMERQSGGIVFSEDEFADQLIEAMAGRYASLLHNYAQNTCLFIGLSLEDSTLKHLLRQSALLNPGHYHYYVDYYAKTADKPTQSEQQAIYEANFNLYNLITLFLTGEELKEVGYLVALENDEFANKAGHADINIAFYYYVIGAIGAGKSSTISFLRSLKTHDEWPDFRLPELGKRFKRLPSEKEKRIDNWINKQFKKKNDILLKTTAGLHVIDRAPLDPISFKKKPDRCMRADSLVTNICGLNGATKIRNGHVILLEGEADVLEERAQASGKEYTAGDLQEMQEVLHRVYQFRKGVSIIDTRHKSPEQIVKEAARIIHAPTYEEADLHGRLAKIANGGFTC